MKNIAQDSHCGVFVILARGRLRHRDHESRVALIRVRHCLKKTKVLFNPLIDGLHHFVFTYLETENKRVGKTLS